MNGNAATWFVDRHVDEGRADKAAFREARNGLGGQLRIVLGKVRST